MLVTAKDLMDSADPNQTAITDTIPRIKRELRPPTILGNGALITFAERGGDVSKVFQFFSGQVRDSAEGAAALLDVALLHLIQQRRVEAYHAQSAALTKQQIFRVIGTKGEEITTQRRVLALVAPGDFMNNAQLEFLVDNSTTGLDVLYVIPGEPLPAEMPEHDVAFCAVNESDENIPILNRLSGLLKSWPRPVLNAPQKIAGLSRDAVSSLFQSSQKICSPQVRRISASYLRQLAKDEVSLDSLLPGAAFPVLARPVGSHCGENLEKINGLGDIEGYLKTCGGDESGFFLASFWDYKSTDGLYRKYRVVLIDKAPYLCHMAACAEWKIHYINAGMAESAAKREEEARAMQTFDSDFARRHGEAFTELSERIGLDYFGIDCAELPDGRLLLFEAETAMVVHDMDSPTLYPYKPVQMAKIFSAFRAFMDRASARPPGIAVS